MLYEETLHLRAAAQMCQLGGAVIHTYYSQPKPEHQSSEWLKRIQEFHAYSPYSGCIGQQFGVRRLVYPELRGEPRRAAPFTLSNREETSPPKKSEPRAL